MKLNEYQQLALTTRLPTADEEYCVLNLAAEAGEVAGKYAKARRDGRQLDFDQQVKKELGDVLWHVAAIAIDKGFTLEDVAMSNIAKLSQRKANGNIQGSGDDR